MAVTVTYKVDPEKVEQPLERLRRVYEMVEDATLDEDEIHSAYAELEAVLDEVHGLMAEISAATP
jgi:hypothetical protein